MPLTPSIPFIQSASFHPSLLLYVLLRHLDMQRQNDYTSSYTCRCSAWSWPRHAVHLLCRRRCLALAAKVYRTVIFPRRISALLSYSAPSASGPHFATSTKMLNLLRAPSLLQATAVAALVAVLGIVIRRRYFSPLSDIPRPFQGSFSILQQLYKIFTKYTKRATIDVYKKQSVLQSSLAGLSGFLLSLGKFIYISYNEVSISDLVAVYKALQSLIDKVSMRSVLANRWSLLTAAHRPTSTRSLAFLTRDTSILYLRLTLRR